MAEDLIRVGTTLNVEYAIHYLELAYLDKEAVIELLFIKQQEGKKTVFFSELTKEQGKELVSNEKFMEIYNEYLLARKKGDEMKKQELIIEARGLAPSKTIQIPTKRNP